MILQVMFNALVQTAIYMVMALGLTLIFGVMKIPNLTHGAMYALGAFIHYTLYEFLEIPFVPALFLAAPIAFFRRRHFGTDLFPQLHQRRLTGHGHHVRHGAYQPS